MSMPGFTGGTSLYTTKGRYRSAAGVNPALAGRPTVLPQLPIGFCMADCDSQYDWGSLDNAICKFGCMDSGGGGGGGGGVDVRACIQCKAACSKKPLSQRNACRQLCAETVC